MLRQLTECILRARRPQIYNASISLSCINISFTHLKRLLVEQIDVSHPRNLRSLMDLMGLEWVFEIFVVFKQLDAVMVVHRPDSLMCMHLR